jgi:hypothetical protein
VKFTVPVKLISEANEHAAWQARQRRAKAQRSATTAAVHDAGYAIHRELVVGRARSWYAVRLVSPPLLPLKVTITRVAPRELDSDNLTGSAKHVRDQVAELLGVDDRSPKVKWVVEQRRGQVGEHACEIRIEAMGEVAA